MVEPRIFKLPEIRSNRQGYASLAYLAHELAEFSYTSIVLDLRWLTWFEANMCAPLRAILYKTGRRLNTVRFDFFSPKVKNILSKNGFLSNYGVPRLPDTPVFDN